MLNQKESLSFVRKEAKKVGLVLRRKKMTINGSQAYCLVRRADDETIVDNMTLASALNLTVSGEIYSLKA